VEFQVDESAKKTLNEFTELRNALLETMDIPDEKLAASAPMAPGSGDDQGKVKKEKTSPEQLLIAEANATLDLAESQLEEGMNEAAARNFHTATVYFRVLESIVPHMSTELHARLQYSATRTRQCSHLLQNFVHEHFEGILSSRPRCSSWLLLCDVLSGVKCSDIYDIYTEKRIGKGSYGSVYYCKHKKSGEEFACKVPPLSPLSLSLLPPSLCYRCQGDQRESYQLTLSAQAPLGDRHHEGSILPPLSTLCSHLPLSSR
jgi:hypothetical protein